MEKINETGAEACVGYIKYVGKSVEGGFLDARKSAEALLGLDEILRYFLLKDDPALKNADFEIPVRMEKGSIAMLVGGITAVAYFSKAAQKAAEKGLLNTDSAKDAKAIVSSAMESARWVLKIATHMGSLAVREFKSGSIDQGTQEVEVLNGREEILRVPKKYLDVYRECPMKLFSKSASVITHGCTLELGVFDGEKSETVSIAEKQKNIFYAEKEEKESDVVFPEFKHGQSVDLEGEITRATESMNTIGFRYGDHTLICRPEKGHIADFKQRVISKMDNQLFPKVKLIGVVDRANDKGDFKERKPEIVFSDIMSLEVYDNRLRLF